MPLVNEVLDDLDRILSQLKDVNDRLEKLQITSEILKQEAIRRMEAPRVVG